MNIRQKLLYMAFSLRMFQNWTKIVSDVFRDTPPTMHVLRNGPIIHSNDDIIVVIDEIFDNHLYDHPHVGLNATDKVLDIGAHVGVFTLYARTKTKGTIIAVEPLPNNYQLLQRNIEANNLQDVITINKAVTSSRRPIKLFVTGASSGNRTGRSYAKRRIIEQLY